MAACQPCDKNVWHEIRDRNLWMCWFALFLGYVNLHRVCRGFCARVMETFAMLLAAVAVELNLQFEIHLHFSRNIQNLKCLNFPLISSSYSCCSACQRSQCSRWCVSCSWHWSRQTRDTKESSAAAHRRRLSMHAVDLKGKKQKQKLLIR